MDSRGKGPMQVTDENTASHHQEASAHYLQGRFAEALAI